MRALQSTSTVRQPPSRPFVGSNCEFAVPVVPRAARRIAVSDTGTPLRFETGRRLRALRTERGWSQVQLAAAAGCGHTHVPEIETGKANCNLDTLDELALALTVDIVQLFAETAYPGIDCALAKERLPVNLRKLRLKHGLTQFEVAARANLNLTYVARIENGMYSLTIDRVNELARGLGVEARELFKRRKPRYRDKPVRSY